MLLQSGQIAVQIGIFSLCNPITQLLHLFIAVVIVFMMSAFSSKVERGSIGGDETIH